jgi:predicted amidohydrolase
VYAVALNPPPGSLGTREEYTRYLERTLASYGGNKAKGKEWEKGGHPLVVMPAGLGLLLALMWGDLGRPENYSEAYKAYCLLPPGWQEEFLDLHREAARKGAVALVPGTYGLRDGNGLFLASSLISPGGDVVLEQRQVFLSRLERDLGFSRGDTLDVVDLGELKIGLILGTDAFYPETGRILALQGADLIGHPGSLTADSTVWRQRAGMWQQVQQNQFFCIESQLQAVIAGEEFCGESLLHGPCEMTEGLTGILGEARSPGEPVEGFLNDEARQKVIAQNSLLKLLNPAAYSPLG